MKVILSKDVDKLGKAGDVIKVKDGFARNFLIPRGLAFIANESNTKRVEQEKLKKEKQLSEEMQSLREKAGRLSQVSLTLAVEANEKNELYGSVNNVDIAQALKEEGYSLDKENIRLETAIKELGIYEVPVKLHPEIEAKVKVWVVKK